MNKSIYGGYSYIPRFMRERKEYKEVDYGTKPSILAVFMFWVSIFAGITALAHYYLTP